VPVVKTEVHELSTVLEQEPDLKVVAQNKEVHEVQIGTEEYLPEPEENLPEPVSPLHKDNL